MLVNYLPKTNRKTSLTNHLLKQQRKPSYQLINVSTLISYLDCDRHLFRNKTEAPLAIIPNRANQITKSEPIGWG